MLHYVRRLTAYIQGTKAMAAVHAWLVIQQQQLQQGGQ
jgi:hypothetical protein